MRIKRDIRKIAELGIGIIAVTTLVLAGCGGGGGGSSAGGTPAATVGNGTALQVVPSLGQFKDGATVRVKDYQGNLLDTRTIVGGVANLYPNNTMTANYPLQIEAGTTGDQYFDEKSGTYQTISGVAAIRAIVPFQITSQVVGVTPLTEIAAAGLIDPTTGNLPAGITQAAAQASSVGANAAVGSLFGVANPLAAPVLVSTVAGVNNLTDAYAIVLAGLANTAAAGSNAQSVATALSTSFNGTGASTSAISKAITSLQNTLKAMAANAPSGTSLSTVAATVGTALPPPPTAKLSDLSAGIATIAQNAISSGSTVDSTAIMNIAQTQAAAVASAVANGTSVSNAVASATTNGAAAVTAAPMVTSAKALLKTVRADFVMQASGVQADMNSIISPFQEAQNFALFLYQGSMLASNGTFTATANTQIFKSVTVNGWPCVLMSVTSGTGTVVCQWPNNNGSAASTIHQLTITGPNVAASTGGLDLTPQGNYTWSDTIVPSITLLNSSVLGTTVSGVTPATGTAVGSTTNVTLNGNILPGEGPTSTHSLTTFTSLAVTETVNVAANTNTFAMTGSIAEMSGTTSVDSITLSTGSNMVQNASKYTTVSANLVTQAKTQNYEFDGTVALSNFAPDMSSTTNPNPSYNAGTISFTGSITGLNGNAALGKFLTTTGTGLAITSDRTKYDPSQALSSTNFPAETGTFAGTITDGTVTDSLAMTFSTTNNTVSTTLVATDTTSKNSITVVENGTITGTAAVTVNLGANTTGKVSYSNASTSLTQIGTISGGVVTFTTDNSTAPLN